MRFGQKGWIEALFAGSMDSDEKNSLLIISIDLTKEGYSRIPASTAMSSTILT